MKNLEAGDCFAIWHGIFAGKSMIYIETIGDKNCFLIMTNPFIIGKFTTKCLEKAEQDIQLDEHGKIPGYIDFIEKIPDKIFIQIKEQYNHEKQFNKRIVYDLFQQRKQSLINEV